MFDLNALSKHYETLTDAELLGLRSEGGLTDEAEPVLANEIRRRNLKETVLKRHKVHKRILLREEAKEKGCGGRGPSLLFFGRHFLNQADKEANIQIRTKWFALGGIPLIPLGSYRFKCTGDPNKWFHWDTQQRVINRVPLNLDTGVSNLDEDCHRLHGRRAGFGWISLLSGLEKTLETREQLAVVAEVRLADRPTLRE